MSFVKPNDPLESESASRGFFEKFWNEQASNFRHSLGEKIWQAGWNSAFRLMAPRFAHIKIVCEKASQDYSECINVYEDEFGRKWGTTHLEALVEIADDKNGYEQPLIDKMMEFKKIREQIIDAGENNVEHLDDLQFREFVMNLMRKLEM